MRAVGHYTVEALDGGHDVLEEVGGEGADLCAAIFLPICAEDVAVRHGEDHGACPALGDQIIKDEIGAADARPAGIGLARAVEEIENGVAAAGVSLVAGRGVDVHAPGGAGDDGVIPVDVHGSVRDVGTGFEDGRFGARDVDQGGEAVLCKGVLRIENPGAV